MFDILILVPSGSFRATARTKTMTHSIDFRPQPFRRTASKSLYKYLVVLVICKVRADDDA